MDGILSDRQWFVTSAVVGRSCRRAWAAARRRFRERGCVHIEIVETLPCLGRDNEGWGERDVVTRVI